MSTLPSTSGSPAAESGRGRAAADAGKLPEALRLEGVARTYPGTRRSPARVALAGATLAVPAGEWLALLGPNGSGKSTMVRIIAGTERADAGRAAVFGTEIGSAGAAARRAAAARLSVVFQRPGLDSLLTVRENLRAQASLFGLTGRRREERIAEVAALLGLPDWMDDLVRTLSGGYQRRADLARALLHQPDLLILDEATTGLDHEARSAFLGAIADLRGGRPSMTIVMTTHLMDEAERADRVVMMAGGRVVADGSPASLRGSCGGRLVRVHASGPEQLATLKRTVLDAGLSVVRDGPRLMIARGRGEGDPALERAAVELTRAGAAFEIAPPDLGDAYVALTGEPLNGEEGPGPRKERAA